MVIWWLIPGRWTNSLSVHFSKKKDGEYLKIFFFCSDYYELLETLRKKPYFPIPTSEFHLAHCSQWHMPEHHTQNLQNRLPTQDKRKTFTIYTNVVYFNTYLSPIIYIFFIFLIVFLIIIFLFLEKAQEQKLYTAF